MKAIRTAKIKIKDIKHLENSRLRSMDDVSDLMQDIEQRGLLHPVGIRESDNALIFGNRRVKSYTNLDYDEIECTYFADVTDEDLLITNLAENLKSKTIGSIEVGRIVSILMSKGMSVSEIAIKLGVTKSRVSSSFSCYNVTKDTPFEKLIVFGLRGNAKDRKGIPESLVWKIQDLLTRIPGFNLSKQEWNILLNACENGELTGHNIPILKGILTANPKIGLIRALTVLKESRMVYATMAMSKVALAKSIADEKAANEVDLVRIILKKYNKNLLF